MKPLTKESRNHIFPGFGPHAGLPDNEQHEIPMKEELIRTVSEKIVRGCEFKLGNGRIVEGSEHISICFAHENNIPHVIQMFDRISTVHIEPGFRVKRSTATDDYHQSVAYKIDIWDTWTIYALIETTEPNHSGSGNQTQATQST